MDAGLDGMPDTDYLMTYYACRGIQYISYLIDTGVNVKRRMRSELELSA